MPSITTTGTQPDSTADEMPPLQPEGGGATDSAYSAYSAALAEAGVRAVSLSSGSERQGRSAKSAERCPGPTMPAPGGGGGELWRF